MNSNEINYLLCDDPKTGKSQKGAKTRIRHNAPSRITVGARTATFTPGDRFWKIEYRGRNGRKSYPSGYTLGANVSAGHVRDVLSELAKADARQAGPIMEGAPC